MTEAEGRADPYGMEADLIVCNTCRIWVSRIPVHRNLHGRLPLACKAHLHSTLPLDESGYNSSSLLENASLPELSGADLACQGVHSAVRPRENTLLAVLGTAAGGHKRHCGSYVPKARQL